MIKVEVNNGECNLDMETNNTNFGFETALVISNIYAGIMDSYNYTMEDIDSFLNMLKFYMIQLVPDTHRNGTKSMSCEKIEEGEY